jgi:hypothetical protein
MKRKPKIRVRENSWLARLSAGILGFDHVAMVFGHTIHLYHTSKERFFGRPGWLLHELRHVAQYERHGLMGFLFLYAKEYLKKGYWRNALEAEARASEHNYSLLRRYDLSDYASYMK